MLPVYTASEMRACDDAATELYGIPGIILMENAARGAADYLDKAIGGLSGKAALLLCGKGNNGGDGYAIARHLLNRGARVGILALSDTEALSGDCRTNAEITRLIADDTQAINIKVIDSQSDLEGELSAKPSVIIDALLGTGLSSPLQAPIHDIVRRVNDSGVPVFAIDIPSGIHADSGAELGVAMRARWTATMGGLKRGLLTGAGRVCAGEVRIIDIGMPVSGYAERATKTFLVEIDDVRRRLPVRPHDAHKYSMGSVFAIGGSIGYTGAAAMAAEAALRSGAGIVTLGAPECVNPILENKLTEVITIPLPQTPGGCLSLNGLAKALDSANRADAVFLGPGISRDSETLDLARVLIESVTAPLIIDADALHALIDHCHLLKESKAPRILTPHCGEFSRLTGIAARDIETGRIDTARAFAEEHNVTLLLKGSPTVTALPDGNVMINSTGNPGMATAGAGDVLTGMIAGLIAQGISPTDAAFCGAWLHGQAGDIAEAELGAASMTASDIIKKLPSAFFSLRDS